MPFIKNTRCISLVLIVLSAIISSGCSGSGGRSTTDSSQALSGTELAPAPPTVAAPSETVTPAPASPPAPSNSTDTTPVAKNPVAKPLSVRTLSPVVTSVQVRLPVPAPTPVTVITVAPIASDIFSVRNADSETCYYRVSAINSSGNSVRREVSERLPRNFIFPQLNLPAPWSVSTAGCAGGSPVPCGAREVTVEVFGGRDVSCDFFINIPGHSLFVAEANTVENPREAALKQPDSNDRSRAGLRTAHCPVGATCYILGGVTVRRTGGNKFSFQTNDSRGFNMSGTQTIHRTFRANPIDSDFFTLFQNEFMQGLQN